MRYLLDRPVRTAQELSWQLSGCQSPHDLKRAALELLIGIFQADYCGLNDINLSRGANPFRLEIYPSHPAVTSMAVELGLQVAAESLTDHPIINHYATPGSPPRPVRLSDLIGDLELRRTRAYEKALRPIGARWELALMTRRGVAEAAEATAFALTRSSSDFTDECLVTAEAVQPVLVAISASMRARSVGPPASGWDGLDGALTEREVEVLQLVAAGLTAQSIARALRITRRTVEKHLEHVYAKLGVHDRLSAVNYCTRVGLLT
jgi:DNA-binding CsgD family transcriptional regulator